MRKNLVYSVMAAVLVAWALFVGGCTVDESSHFADAAGTVVTRLEVENQQESDGSHPDAYIGSLQGFRFENGVLQEVITAFQSDGNGAYVFHPQRIEGELCFLANAGEVEALQHLLPLRSTKAEFLSVRADRSALVSPEGHVALSGWMDLETASSDDASVMLKRSVARIDLASFEQGVEVLYVKVAGFYREGYLNVQSVVTTPTDAPTETFEQEYADFSLRRETLLYLPEQANQHIQVDMVVAFDGAQHRLSATLPAVIRRNTVYTLSVHGRGGALSVDLEEDGWESGGQVESVPLLKGLVDVEASDLSEGVRVNTSGDSVFIPYVRTESRLVIRGEAGTQVSVDGQVEGVVVQPVSGRGMLQIAQVAVSTETRMPGTREAFVYLDVYRQQVCTGRVVLVFEPSPVRLEGLIRLDTQGVCDFDRYVEGELGRLTLPPGKVARLEFDEDASKWMKLVPDDGVYRIVGGWKPNDPQADGRVQEGHLVIMDEDGRNREVYPIRRRNWGLPVVYINGTWWCKYNLRGNVKNFSDQVPIGADPAPDADLAAYLNQCSEEELLALLGYQYQAGYPDGYPLKHNGTAFYYEGIRASAGNFGTMAPEDMAPDGYRVPAYEDYAFFAGSNDFNLGGQGTHTYRNAEGEELSVTITERNVSLEGHPYGIIAFYDFQYKGAHWVLCGLGHQWNTEPGSIARMSLLLATQGDAARTWMMEGYAHTEKPGENWLKFVAHNNQKTRVIRCVKKPVEYIYE